MLISTDTMNSVGTWVRAHLNQRICGTTPLQMIIVQVDIQYGPNARIQNERLLGLDPAVPGDEVLGAGRRS